MRETDLKRYDSVKGVVYVVQRRGDSIDWSHKTRERRWQIKQALELQTRGCCDIARRG